MTPAPPSARGRDDSYEYEDDRYRDEEHDDGSVATFAPALPRLPRRRSVPANRDLPRSAPPRSAPPRSAPPPEPDPPAPPRPSSPLAELFAEEEEEEAERAAARPARRWGNDRPTAEPPRPAPAPAPTPAPAVTVREEPREDADEPEVAAEPIWVGVARGVAATLAAGALTGAALILKGAPAGPMWLGAFAPLPDAALAPLLAFCGTGLGLFAARSNLPTPPRWGATLAAAAAAGGALKVAIAGGLADGFGPSLAWHLVICASLILAATRWSPGTATARAGRLAPLIGLLVCGLTFPLADGALAEIPAEQRGPAAAARAIAGWWGDALPFDRPTDEAS
ncbi:hypothetical protein [Alienimonas sp. DA493]|uniref:hypothetical protein n=1 Tax=Alienimonas sp. DA493 TaxID=3373605 RepID=UPI003754CF4B